MGRSNSKDVTGSGSFPTVGRPAPAVGEDRNREGPRSHRYSHFAELQWVFAVGDSLIRGWRRLLDQLQRIRRLAVRESDCKQNQRSQRCGGPHWPGVAFAGAVLMPAWSNPVAAIRMRLFSAAVVRLGMAGVGKIRVLPVGPAARPLQAEIGCDFFQI